MTRSFSFPLSSLLVSDVSRHARYLPLLIETGWGMQISCRYNEVGEGVFSVVFPRPVKSRTGAGCAFWRRDPAATDKTNKNDLIRWFDSIQLVDSIRKVSNFPLLYFRFETNRQRRQRAKGENLGQQQKWRRRNRSSHQLRLLCNNRREHKQTN